MLVMDLAAPRGLLRIAAPQDESSIIRHQRWHIPRPVSDEPCEKGRTGFAAILGDRLLNGLSGIAFSIEGALQEYLDVFQTLRPGIGGLGHADSFDPRPSPQ